MTEVEKEKSIDFVRTAVNEDTASGRYDGRVVTRFPPEPNGYLHIGHAKSICLNFGIAAENKDGICHLRFDDTNPIKEEEEFVESIKRDISWLGFDWGENLYFASDYFEQLHDWAVELIKKGKAFVCDLSMEEIRANRGRLAARGTPSPYRDRSVEENLDLFARMRDGEFEEGSHVLRAKIDMEAPNLHMRDPIMYRILKVDHNRTGDKWCIYPMYDFTHGQSDSLEKITHSICTLEFREHRPLYDWYLDALEIYHPQQIEFARLNLTYTVLSKRRLTELVDEGHVTGWDDPRLPTLSGMRRRGYPPEAIREFCNRIGVATADSTVDFALLEFVVREQLNRVASRYMAVLNPLRVVIENYPEDQTEELEAVNNPEDPAAGSRQVPFSRVLYIERDDFMEEPPKKFFRLAPGREVRLRYAYFVTCTGAIKNDAGEIIELRCTYDPATRGGNAPDGRKVKATMHWVAEATAVNAEVRLYETLFSQENPNAKNSSTTDSNGTEESPDWKSSLNPNSLETRSDCKLEPALADITAGQTVQFERLGYFCTDTKDHSADKPTFNRTTTLRDAWKKIQKKQNK